MATKKPAVESAAPASDKKKALETAVAQIERAYGKGSIMRLGGNVDVMVAGTAPTMDDGKVKLTITYEDEAGVVSSVEKEIQLYVTEPVPMEDMMDVGNMDDIGMMEPEEPPYQKYLIPGAAGAVLLIVVIVIIRRKKKKAGMDDEVL